MSLMSLGIKINALQKGIKEGRFTTKEQVKAAAQGSMGRNQREENRDL